MNHKVMFQLSYGLYVLSSKMDNKANGCIVNTVMQVTDEPLQMIIAVNKENYTHELLLASREAVLSILSISATFDTIRHFGFQSGREVDKFADVSTAAGPEGIPYLKDGCCGYISCRITEIYDLGTHSAFLATVTDGDILSTEAPLTYDYYHEHLKPRPGKAAAVPAGEFRNSTGAGQFEGSADAIPAVERKITGWRCIICGYIYEGAELPPDFICPWCKHGAVDFEAIYE